MKIAIAEHPINSPGGLILWAEWMAQGLIANGHSVDHLLCRWTPEVGRFNSRRAYEIRAGLLPGWEFGWAGPHHQANGWAWNRKQVVPYAGEKALYEARQRLSTYDAIIWNFPVVTKRADTFGNTDWVKLYDNGAVNIGMVHDGNLPRYPWILQVASYLTGLACVHPCAYTLASEVPVSRALIFNPHNLTVIDRARRWGGKLHGFVSVQNWKRWKNVDEIVRAIPFLPNDVEKIMCGGGIEQCYMASIEKVKKEYCRPDGMPIWLDALDHGMSYRGFVPDAHRGLLFDTFRVFVDMSHSDSYAKHGCHLNRTVIEAMAKGMLVVTTPMNLFKSDVDIELVEPGMRPQELASRIESTIFREASKAESTIEANYDSIQVFDHVRIASEMIDLIEGKPTGFYNKLETGKPSDRFRFDSDLAWETHFGGRL